MKSLASVNYILQSINYDPSRPHLQYTRYVAALDPFPRRTMYLLRLVTLKIGKPRLSKFYTPLPPLIQQSLIAQIFSYISDRPSGVCNFLDAPDLVFPSSARSSTEKGKGRFADDGLREEDDVRVIYRHYATLYFV